MELLETELWMDIVLVGSVLISWMAVSVALFCMYRMRRQVMVSQKLYERINHELKVTNSGSIGMGQRLMAVERKLKQPTSKPQAAAVESPGVENLSYVHAARLISSGVKVEEIARSCGLSRAEASLMETLHRQNRAAVA